MIGLEDRRVVARNILKAHTDGARLRLACETAGIDVRTLQRWKAGQGLVSGDGRPAAVRPVPAHALSPVERAEVLRVANETRFADVPPARIVPMLADEGVYVASESSFARVLRAHGQAEHRGRAKAGARQGSCRLCHAASGCISLSCDAVATTESRSGLSVTAPMGDQLRVCRDQRAGLRSRAWT